MIKSEALKQEEVYGYCFERNKEGKLIFYLKMLVQDFASTVNKICKSQKPVVFAGADWHLIIDDFCDNNNPILFIDKGEPPWHVNEAKRAMQLRPPHCKEISYHDLFPDGIMANGIYINSMENLYIVIRLGIAELMSFVNYVLKTKKPIAYASWLGTLTLNNSKELPVRFEEKNDTNT